jgi:hypothetical protein
VPTPARAWAVIILTALGVLPAIAADTRPERDDRFQYSRLNPIDLERATVVGGPGARARRHPRRAA